jgi:hypothetical protein
VIGLLRSWGLRPHAHVVGSLTSAILFVFCATSAATSVLEEWRVGSLADPKKHILCERRWRGDTRASKKASRRPDGFK